jgi:hypothetical protein
MNSTSRVLRSLPLRMHIRLCTRRALVASHIEIAGELRRFQFLSLLFGREPSALMAREDSNFARVIRTGCGVGRMEFKRHAAFAANGV